MVRHVEELYKAAAASVDTFTSLLNEATSGTAAVVTVTPFKSQARVLEKARDDYGDREPGPPISWVYDVLRGAVVCPNEETILQVVDKLRSSAAQATVLRLKNRFVEPTPGEEKSDEGPWPWAGGSSASWTSSHP